MLKGSAVACPVSGDLLHIARVYDDPGDALGARLLVDRVWPRGLRKDALRLDDWVRAVAPSPALRKWFAHDPLKWDGFRARYLEELAANGEAVEQCLRWCRNGPVVLLFAARDRERNQAVVLRAHLLDALEAEARG